MPSLILGSGVDSLKITGDVLRVDPLLNQIGNSVIQKEDQSVSFYSGPEDDIKVSQIPKAVRRISEFLASSFVLTLSHDLKPFSFHFFNEEVDAWLPDEGQSFEGLPAYAIDKKHVVFCGLVPLGRKLKVFSPISSLHPEFGIAISSVLGLLTPWNVGR